MKKNNGVLYAAMALCIGSVIWLGFVLMRPAPASVSQFEKPPFEPQVIIPKSEPDKSEEGWLEAGDVRVHISEITRDGYRINIDALNPKDSSIWMKVRICDEEGVVLGESGVFKSGEQIEEVTLDKHNDSESYVIEIMGYEPETYHSAGCIRLNAKL